MIAFLHNIRSIYNVGSIFRTADAVGIKKLYLCGITPGPVDKYQQPVQKLTKVSLGAENSVAWEKVESTTKQITKLKNQGYKILAVEQSNHSVPYYQIKPTDDELDKIALVVGKEVGGIDPEILSQADQILEIPMRGQKESLNVSVAFGIVTFSLIQNSHQK